MVTSESLHHLLLGISRLSVMLRFEKKLWMCGRSVPSLENYEWEENDVNVEEEELGGSCDQRMVARESFWATKWRGVVL